MQARKYGSNELQGVRYKAVVQGTGICTCENRQSCVRLLTYMWPKECWDRLHSLLSHTVNEGSHAHRLADDFLFDDDHIQVNVHEACVVSGDVGDCYARR